MNVYPVCRVARVLKANPQCQTMEIYGVSCGMSIPSKTGLSFMPMHDRGLCA